MAMGNSSNLSGTPKLHSNVCYPPMSVVSNGILQGDLPLNFALPLLIVQIAIVLLVTRTMGILFRPIKQPRVLAEIIGGVVLGPTALGRNQLYMKTIFPPQSMPLLETVANMGLMFFIFMVGLGLDLHALRKTGKHALLLALVGIAVPFTASIGLADLVRRTNASDKATSLVPLVVFLGAPISMSAFSVLVRILAELKMLNTEMARLAVPSGALNDVVIWTLLAVGVATAGPATDQASPLTPLYVLLCGAAYGLLMLTVVRKLMGIVAVRAVRGSKTPGGCETYVCMTLVAVLLAGLVSDGIGVHPVVGPFLLGLVIPKNNEFPRIMTEKMEDMVTGLLVPLFFASSGLKTNLGALHGTSSIAFLLLFVATAATGKIAATFVTAKLIGLETRQAFILGFLMNTKGLAVLIVLNIGRDLKVLTDKTFAILVATCLLTSFATTPVVKALCKPIFNDDDSNVSRQQRRCVEVTMGSVDGEQKMMKAKEELRILTCVYKPHRSGLSTMPNCSSSANLLEAMRGSVQGTCTIKIYALHLLDILDCPSTLLGTTNIRCSNATTCPNPPNSTTPALPFVFPASPLLHKPTIRTISTLSDLSSMHEDILKVATKKRASLILLPYDRPSHHLSYNGFHNVNQKVFDHAPCSVAILVEPASMEMPPSFFAFTTYKVVLLFIGGHDDREALAIASRMLDHPGVTMNVVRMVCPLPHAQHNEMVAHDLEINSLAGSSAMLDKSKEKILDDDAISNFKRKALQNSPVLEEAMLQGGQTLLEGINAIIKDMNDVNLFIVGKRQPTVVGVTYQCRSEVKELGDLGDILVSTRHDCHACILVVQHPCVDTRTQSLRKSQSP